MARPKKKLVTEVVVPDFTPTLIRFTEAVKPEVADLLKRLHIKTSMSPTQVVMLARDYLAKQPNQVRACNAILFKLGVKSQFKDEPRKARVYMFTAIEESMLQGEKFDPLTVPAIAEKRLLKITAMMGPDVESVDNTSVASINNIKIKSSKELVTEIFMANKDSPTSDLVKMIVDRIQIKKASAYSLLYAVRKSLIV